MTNYLRGASFDRNEYYSIACVPINPSHVDILIPAPFNITLSLSPPMLENFERVFRCYKQCSIIIRARLADHSDIIINAPARNVLSRPFPMGIISGDEMFLEVVEDMERCFNDGPGRVILYKCLAAEVSGVRYASFDISRFIYDYFITVARHGGRGYVNTGKCECGAEGSTSHTPNDGDVTRMFGKLKAMRGNRPAASVLTKSLNADRQRISVRDQHTQPMIVPSSSLSSRVQPTDVSTVSGVRARGQGETSNRAQEVAHSKKTSVYTSVDHNSVADRVRYTGMHCPNRTGSQDPEPVKTPAGKPASIEVRSNAVETETAVTSESTQSDGLSLGELYSAHRPSSRSGNSSSAHDSIRLSEPLSNRSLSNRSTVTITVPDTRGRAKRRRQET